MKVIMNPIGSPRPLGDLFSGFFVYKNKLSYKTYGGGIQTFADIVPSEHWGCSEAIEERNKVLVQPVSWEVVED